MTDTVLDTRDLSMRFGGVQAVNNVNFSLKERELRCLIGPNGAGKSTFFKCLTGQIRLNHSHGRVFIRGHDVTGWRAYEIVRLGVGIKTQVPSVMNGLSVEENLWFYSSLYGLRGDAQRIRLAEVVAELGLGKRLKQFTGQLSGGWRQRVSLGCAVAHRPEILFLDEPTAGVDPAARKLFWERIYAYAKAGITILVTTHYMDEAERCERLAVISRGVLLAHGTPAEVRTKFQVEHLEDVFIELQHQSGELV